MNSLTNFLATPLRPILTPISHWLLSEKRTFQTWHFETLFVAVILIGVALATTPNPSTISNTAELTSFAIIWLSVVAVLGSFLHAKVGYRMSEALAASAAPPASCYEWSSTYWLLKEIFWFIIFFLSGAYPALAGNIIFILYPVWRKIHVEERAKVRN